MKYIDEVDLTNKKVILRCDFNVPIKNGAIQDNTRIQKSLVTINYLLNKGCSLILMSHLGRIKTREDKLTNTLKPVAQELSNLLNKRILFSDSPVGMDVLKSAKELKSGEILLLENTRFCDFPEKLESGNDDSLSNYWASLGDAFVVDAFGSLHRAHASVAGISRYLPTYYGLLVKEEIEGLSHVIDHPKRPLGVFMGGAKVDDKLQYIKDMLPKIDYLLLGGGIANSFLYALGYDVKDSLRTEDPEILKELKNLTSIYKNKIVLPIDFVFENNQILDLNTKSINKYKNVLSNCKTIFINGSCGKFEDSKFAKGTIDLFKSLKDTNAYVAAGGGDTLNAINEFDLTDNFNFLSSGGGASLEYISKGKLQAIEFIEKEFDKK